MLPGACIEGISACSHCWAVLLVLSGAFLHHRTIFQSAVIVNDGQSVFAKAKDKHYCSHVAGLSEGNAPPGTPRHSRNFLHDSLESRWQH